MNRRHATAVATLTLLLLGSAATAQEVRDTTRLPVPMRAARAGFTTALTALDARAAGNHFSDDVVVDFAGDLFTGRQAVVEQWLLQTLGGLASIRFGEGVFTLSEAEITERSAYSVLPAGETQAQPGTYVATWKLLPGAGWRISRLAVIPN
jgi:ketosteroid isomerase-like protein